MDEPLRVAELLTAVSLATDLGQGQPMDWELRGCLLALGLAEAMDLPRQEQRLVYDLSLLRYIGCTAHAHEVALSFGDEIAARQQLMAIDLADKGAMVRTIARTAGSDKPLPRRAVAIAATIGAGPAGVAEGFRASCEVATMFAEQLGFEPEVGAALAFGFERWDGKGLPDGAAGERIPRALRVVQVAQDLEVLTRTVGVDEGFAVVDRRAGSMYDPTVVVAAGREGRRLLAAIDDCDPWESVLASEPGEPREIPPSGIDDALAVMADYVDLKSPWTAGHSRAVGELAASAATAAALDRHAVALARRAGLAHDLGAAGVPNSVWDKPGRLSMLEGERVRMHPYLTHRILSRSSGLGPLAPIAAAHHERNDSSGYHTGSQAAALPIVARILAAADVYVAVTEARAHRPARPRDVAARELAAMVEAGTLDGRAVDAVLDAAGHHPTGAGGWPNGLTDREVEVLRLIVRGHTAKDVARELHISVKTVGSHVEHIYAKIGVSTRGAAALFAMQHRLIDIG